MLYLSSRTLPVFVREDFLIGVMSGVPNSLLKELSWELSWERRGVKLPFKPLEDGGVHITLKMSLGGFRTLKYMKDVL